MTAVVPSSDNVADIRPHYRIAEGLALQVLAFAERRPTAQAHVAFGPAAMQIKTCGRALSRVALDPLRHAFVERPPSIDFQLIMADGKETGIGGPTVRALGLAEVARNPVDDGGQSTLTVSEEWNVFSMSDPEQQRIVVWFADAAAVPEWVVYDQIRNALHSLSYGRAFGMFHAAALLLGATGCLITGKSGSGKSTMTAAAVANGFSSAGDDFVLVETTPLPRVHAVFDTIKVDEKALARFPQFRRYTRNARRPGDKAIVHLYDSAQDRIATGFPLHAILHARLTGERQSRIFGSAPSDAFLALAPSSLLLLRARSKEISAKCAALVGILRPYAFEIGTDLDAAVSTLGAFMWAHEQP